MKGESRLGILVMETFQRIGVDVDVLRHRLPRETTQLCKQAETLSLDDWNRILLACEELAADQHVGLHLTDHIDNCALGLYAWLLLNASTIGEILLLAEKYYPVFYQGHLMEVVRTPSAWQLLYRRIDPCAVDPRHDHEWTLGAFVRLIRTRLDSNWTPRRAFFQTPEPEDTRELQRFVGPNLSFNRPDCGFEVDHVELEYPLSSTNPGLLKILREQADELLSRYVETKSFEATVRLLIMKDLDLGSSSEDAIAQEMGVSLSSLKRSLANLGLSYRGIRENLIRDLATRALVQTDVKISQLAMRLGYSEASAFNHAFARLVGRSPTLTTGGTRASCEGQQQPPTRRPRSSDRSFGPFSHPCFSQGPAASKSFRTMPSRRI